MKELAYFHTKSTLKLRILIKNDFMIRILCKFRIPGRPKASTCFRAKARIISFFLARKQTNMRKLRLSCRKRRKILKF